MAQATTPEIDPKAITVKGRLSFPAFTMAQAKAGNERSTYPKTDDKIAPSFNLLIEQDQLDKIIEHIKTVFIPFAEANYAKDPKSRDALPPKEVKKLQAFLDEGDWSEMPPMFFVNAMSERNLESAPECVASIKLSGRPGVDIVLKASVFSEDQLAAPDPSRVKYPVMLPINETKFEMYAGAYVASTINLFAFFASSAVYGISAGANVAAYMGNYEGERIGGGASIDEDAIFMD